MSTENLVLKATDPTEDILSKPVVNISAEAERYAREHCLSASLMAMKSLVLPGAAIIASVDVDLIRDPGATVNSVICFSIETDAPVSDVLEFDKRPRDFIFEAVPADDRAFFAVRFDFDSGGCAGAIGFDLRG